MACTTRVARRWVEWNRRWRLTGCRMSLTKYGNTSETTSSFWVDFSHCSIRTAKRRHFWALWTPCSWPRTHWLCSSGECWVTDSIPRKSLPREWLDPRLRWGFFLFKKLFLSFQLTMFGTVPKWLNFYSVPYYIFTYILFGLVQACGWPSEIAIMVIFSSKRSAKTISISGELVWEGQSWFCDGRVGRLPACR